MIKIMLQIAFYIFVYSRTIIVFSAISLAKMLFVHECSDSHVHRPNKLLDFRIQLNLRRERLAVDLQQGNV